MSKSQVCLAPQQVTGHRLLCPSPSSSCSSKTSCPGFHARDLRDIPTLYLVTFQVLFLPLSEYPPHPTSCSFLLHLYCYQPAQKRCLVPHSVIKMLPHAFPQTVCHPTWAQASETHTATLPSRGRWVTEWPLYYEAPETATKEISVCLYVFNGPCFP